MGTSEAPVQFADSNPTESRVARFKRLAELTLATRAAFDKWAYDNKVEDSQKETAWSAWQAAMSSVHSEEMFDCLRIATVFDESFRLPQLEHLTDEGRTKLQGNVQQKFASLMKRISVLTLIIQQEQEANPFSAEPKCQASPS